MSVAAQCGLLFKIQVKQMLSLSGMKPGKPGFSKKLGITALVFLGIASALFTYGAIMHLLFAAAIEAGMGAMMMAIVLLMATVLILLLGMLSVVTVVFNARDTELFASLPVPQEAVFTSKFIIVYLTEMAGGAAMLLPASVLYAVCGGDANALFWLAVLAVLLLLPMLPLALSALLALPLMRLRTRFKRRDLATIVMGLVLLVLLVAGQASLNSLMATNSSPEEMLALFQSNEGMISTVAGAFPPVKWAANAIVADGQARISGFLLFVSVSAAAMLACFLLAGRIYYAGALSQLEAQKSARRGYKAGTMKSAKPMRALFIKELKLVLRTPVYAINALPTIFILPLMLVVYKFVPMSGSDASMDAINSLLGRLNELEAMPLILAGVLTLSGMLNPAATTAVSREGSKLWQLQSAPLSGGDILRGKLGFSLAVVWLSQLVTALTLMLVFELSIVKTALALICAATVAWPVTLLSMLPDVLRPKLRWNSETEAMKQNFNSLTGMLTALAAGALLGLAAFLLLKLTPPEAVLFLTGALALTAGYFVQKLMMLTADRVFYND